MFMLLIVAVFALMAGRLFYLQILMGSHYRELSVNNCLRKQRIEPLRGLIFDRSGRLLVDNRPSYDLRIIPNDVRNLDETAHRLSELISADPEEIKKKVENNRGAYGYSSILVERDISRNLMAVLLSRSYELPGIIIATGSRRNYIYDSLGSHLIGYLGEITQDELGQDKYPYKRGGDMVGRYGAEKAFESQLSGVPGAKIVQVNATGNVVDVIENQSAKPGHNLYLTIDFRLQKKAESLLSGKTGAITAIDPENGDVLAMASSPGFSQNAFVDGLNDSTWNALINDPKRPLRNKVVQGEYPPASTYKIVTAMAALEEGAMDKATTVYCPGYFRFGNRVYRCWKEGGHGRMHIVEAISQSCDVFFYQAGKRLGVDRIAEYARGCGLGGKTGVALDHEAKGLVPTAQWKKRTLGVPWQPGENLSIAIGQGFNLATPLQMAMLISAVANNGTLYKPNIMKSVRSVQGGIVEKSGSEEAAKLPADKESLEIIKKGLYDTVNNRRGTAYWYVRSKEIDICGKTGTAQVVGRKYEDEKGEVKKKYRPHAWFIGYAPAENPQIAVSVLIEHGGGGSSVAGPVAKEMMLSYLKPGADKDSDDSEDKSE